MTPRTPQCEVFWSSKSSFEFSGVPEDSNPNFFQVLGFTPTFGQSRVATQFDSRPLKVGNRPLPNIRFESATRRWKDLNEGYNFGLDLVAIRLCSRELGFRTGTVSGQFQDSNLGVPGKKSHLDVASVESCREYYKGESGGFPRIRAVVSQVSPNARGLS
jgi:hypothetical protein